MEKMLILLIISMLQFKLGQLLGHYVQVTSFGGVFSSGLGHALGHSVQVNNSNGVIENKLGQEHRAAFEKNGIINRDRMNPCTQCIIPKLAIPIDNSLQV